VTRLEAALAMLAEAIRAEVAVQAAAQQGAPDRLLSVDEAAEHLGISRSLAYQLIAKGQLHTLKVGRRRLIPSSAVDAYINGQQAQP
jgi:excisionase family DNA binding protein